MEPHTQSLAHVSEVLESHHGATAEMRDPGLTCPRAWPHRRSATMILHRVQTRLRRTKAALRASWWRLIHRGVEAGTGVQVGAGCRLILEPKSRLVLGARCQVDDATTIAVYGSGVIDLGAGAFVGHHCTLAARTSIEIGPGTHLAELVSVRDHDHTVGVPPTSGEMTVHPVVIGADVWIGSKVTVLAGARIGDGAVVGANAVVRGELPARSVCVGVPARVVRLLDFPGELESERSV
jgi:acetyltransferase-like isoleucine patch superfamily enzyme